MKNKQSLLYLVPKASYYNSKEEMINEANRLHDAIFSEDRVLYAYLLFFKNATYFSKSLIIERLLHHSLNKPSYASFLEKDPDLLEIEDALIHYTLFNENITHALKLLLSLKEKRINNNRTSRIILRFLFARSNLDYISIKYKQKVKELLIHALGLGTVHGIVRREEKAMKKYYKMIEKYGNPYDLEVIDFVFNKERQYKSPYFREYFQIRQQFIDGNVQLSQKTNLPLEVLEGFNNYYKRGYNIASLLEHAVVSEKQKIQLQNAVKRQSNQEIEIEINFENYSIIDLFKYLYNKQDITLEEQERIQTTIKHKANELQNQIMNDFILDLSKTAVLLDASDSHEGSKESKYHPLYKNLTLAEIFAHPDKKNLFVTGGTWKNGLLYPQGHTDLSRGLLDVVKAGYENLIVLSDGFENVGNFDKVYQQLKKIGYELNVVHFNPVFSPKNFSFKTISESILAVPFTDEKDIENIALFCLLNSDKEKFKEVIRQKIESQLL